MNYENPASCSPSLVIRGAARDLAHEGCADECHSGNGSRYGHALHGRAGTQYRRPPARRFETGTCPVIEENEHKLE